MNFTPFFVLALIQGVTIIIPVPSDLVCTSVMSNMSAQKIPDKDEVHGGSKIWCIDARLPIGTTPPPQPDPHEAKK